MPIADELRKALTKVEDDGCSCDLMNGWICGIHTAARTLVRKAAELGYNEGSVLGGGDYYQWKKELEALLEDRHE